MKFKRPAAIDPRERRADKQVRFGTSIMARCIQNQDDLDVLLADAKPDMRAAMLERLRPYLSFELETVTADCPRCGMKRGTILAHECLVVVSQ